MPGEVPPSLKKQGLFNISMLDLRQIVLLAVFVGLAAAILFALPGSLTLRIFLGTLVGGSGVALAFATLQGEKLETWLYRTIAFRLSGRRLSVWRRGDVPTVGPVQFAEDEPEPSAAPPPATRPRAPRYHRPVRPEVAGDLSLLTAFANVVIFAIFAALSTYMATGGAQQLVDYASFLARR
jgi:hypothetical protein